MERLQKLIPWPLSAVVSKSDPFALYEPRFEELNRRFLEEFELDALATIHLPDESISLVKDVFVFSCYTGLSYMEVKNLIA